MAMTMPGMSQLIYDTFAGSVADDFAYYTSGGFSDFDRAKFDKQRALFLKAVDTPEKLFKVVDAGWP